MDDVVQTELHARAAARRPCFLRSRRGRARGWASGMRCARRATAGGADLGHRWGVISAGVLAVASAGGPFRRSG